MNTVRIEPSTSPRLIARILKLALPAEEIDDERIARQILLDPNFREEASLAAYVGNEPAGYCWAVRRQVPLENAPDDSEQGYIVLMGVAPELRTIGVGTALLAAAEDYLRTAGCSSVWISPYAPGYFTPGVDERAYAEGLAFLIRHGYEVQSRPLAMSLEFASMVLAGQLGKRNERASSLVEIRPYDPELTVPLLRFAETEFKGDWVRFARDAARAILRGDDPGRLQIAVLKASAGSQTVVGFAHYEAGRFGPIGVGKSVEGNGVGTALMLRTLEAIRSAGYERAWFLWTDDATAERFYTPLGWKEWRRFAVLRKKL